MSVLARIKKEDIEKQISLLQRDPFKNILSDFLMVKPGKAEIKKFANNNPDKWVNAISVLMKASGYNEGASNETNIYMQINNMSDSSLMNEIEKVEREINEIEKKPSLAKEVS